MLRQTRSTAKLVTTFKSQNSNDNKQDAQAAKIFDEIFDDSSGDELTLAQKISTYNITEAWEDRLEQTVRFTRRGKTNPHYHELLSFVAHAAGIDLFYSHSKEYSQLKTTILAERKGEPKATELLFNLIETACLKAAKHALVQLNKFIGMCQSIVISESIQKEIINDFTVSCKQLMQQQMSKLIKWPKLLKINDTNKLFHEMKMFEQMVGECFINSFKKFCALESSADDREKLKTQICQAATAKVDAIVNELKLSQLRNCKGKKLALAALKKYDGHYQQLVEFIKCTVTLRTANGYVLHGFNKKIVSSEEQQKLCHAYLQDLLAHPENDPHKFVKSYYTVNSVSAVDELMSYFNSVQHVFLEACLNNFKRPTLGCFYLFSSTNPHRFYSNLRLANLDRRREIANLVNPLIKQDSPSARIWRLNAALPSDVLELQVVTKNRGRKDKIENIGNYENVFEDICKIKEFLGVDDICIAQWLRMIFNGIVPEFKADNAKANEILQKLQSITYLLFGCEATRNPAMHVINHMLLDLIIGNQSWSFEEAFTGKKNGVLVDPDDVNRMPMTPVGAVAVSRSLLSDYSEFMPYPYTYNGVEDEGNQHTFNKIELIQLEARVVHAWLLLTQFNQSKQSLPQLIFDHIKKHYEKWLEPQLVCDKTHSEILPAESKSLSLSLS